MPTTLRMRNILTYEDVLFNFRQSEAIIIIGDNQDDPGQKGNGSGKSGLNEGTVLALTGTPMRDVSNRDIIRRGTDSGEVELTLTTGTVEIKIWRKFYVGSKSSEYRMWKNGKECKDLYSDANSFNDFVFTTLTAYVEFTPYLYFYRTCSER